jgi:hypothetical protein
MRKGLHEKNPSLLSVLNPLMPINLQRLRAVSPLKIKIHGKKSRHAALRGGI